MRALSEFLRFNVSNSNLRSSIYRRCQRKLLWEEIYNKRLVVSKLDKESKSLYNNVKCNLYLIDFHHVINISLISNENELEQVKFKHLSKLKNLIPNFTWDLVATSSHDPEKVIFNFSSYKLSSSNKDLLPKGLRFAIPPKQIDYSNFMTEFELLYRSRFIYEVDLFIYLKKKIVLKAN